MSTKFNSPIFIIFTILFFTTTIISNVKAGSNYYDILGVPKTATIRQIKKAYRKKAVKFHPDRVKGSAEQKKKAQKKFIEIAKAYGVLSDEKKRKIYDRFGEEGLNQNGGSGGGGFGFDPSSIFSQFFGGGGGGGDDGFHFSFGGGGGGGMFGDHDDEEETEEDFKGEDLYIPIDLSLEDLYSGKIFTFNRIKQSHEKGAKPRPCKCRLGNTVRVVVINGVFKRTRDKDCSNCQDRFKVFKTSSKLLVEVEPGMKNDEKIIFRKEGDATKAKKAGDLHFVVRELKHPKFQRDGDNLRLTMEITLKEALVGFTKTIKHLDGHIVTVKHNTVVTPGTIKEITNEGMPYRHDPENRGSMLIKLLVKFPETLTRKQKKELKRIM